MTAVDQVAIYFCWFLLTLCGLALVAVGIHALRDRRENKRWARNLLATVNRERIKRGAEPLHPELDKVNFPN